jgi:hypothetical protein
MRRSFVSTTVTPGIRRPTVAAHRLRLSSRWPILPHGASPRAGARRHRLQASDQSHASNGTVCLMKHSRDDIVFVLYHRWKNRCCYSAHD